MNLLIITQKVDINDSILGFFHDWIAEFSKHCNKLTVICLEKGEYDLPHNVKVISLGKEHKKSKLKYGYNFFKYIWNERANYDNVFVHMNTVYILMGGLLWKLLKKRVGLWYAHGRVSLDLRLAVALVSVVFTSTKEGCRLVSKKIVITGQGINTALFRPVSKSVNRKSSTFNIISVGRISPVKDYETLINAVEIILKNCDAQSVRVGVIGGVGAPEQEGYFTYLKELVQKKQLGDIVTFRGPLPNSEIIPHLQNADLFVNMSHTGSLDKAVLEAMACGCVVLTCNEAVEDVLLEYGKILMFQKGDHRDFAKKIRDIMKLGPMEKKLIRDNLGQVVRSDHDIENLIKKIVLSLSE